MRFPFSVAVDEGGDIYVCEWGNHRIQRFDPGGRSLGTLGRGGHGEGELYNPWDIAVGPDGRLYVADCENHRIQVFRRDALLSARAQDGPSGSFSLEAGPAGQEEPPR